MKMRSNYRFLKLYKMGGAQPLSQRAHAQAIDKRFPDRSAGSKNSNEKNDGPHKQFWSRTCTYDGHWPVNENGAAACDSKPVGRALRSTHPYAKASTQTNL